MTLPSARARGAFTLVELLVVIAIIGVLVALLLPAVQAAREAANRSSCSNKLKQLAIGVHNFHDTYKKLPRGAEVNVLPQPNPTGTNTYIAGTTWLVYILPFIEQQPLFDRYDFTVRFDNIPSGGATAPLNNDAVGSTVVPTFYCPSGPGPLTYKDPNGAGVNGDPSTHYYGIMGPGGATDNHTIVLNGTTYTYRCGNPATNGAFAFHGAFTQYRDEPGSITTGYTIGLSDFLDGTSNTLMIGERSVHLPAPKTNSYRSWIRGNHGGSGATKNATYPINSTDYNGSNNFNDISFGSNHPGGCQFALGDASVRFVAETINLDIYRAATSLNSGELAPIP
jgi:prepilin-type N-terminal cleavage/methylation domain-containing protein